MPSALEIVPSGGQHFGKKSGLEFVTKIGQIILKARTGQANVSSYADCNLVSQNSPSTNHSFEKALHSWNTHVPIHIHVFKKRDHTLLECWTISFESCDQRLNERTKLDATQLVLLLQSIYSQIRFLPLHSLIKRNIVPKEEIDYTITSYSSACSTGCFPVEVDLTTNRFNSATTSFGVLHVGVVYEKTLETLRSVDHITSNENISFEDLDQSHNYPTSRASEVQHHTQQLKRKSSALDNHYNHVSKCIHLSSIQTLAALKEETRECAERDGKEIGIEIDAEQDTHDVSPSTRLSRPVSIPAASPIGSSPHPFAERPSHAYKSDVASSIAKTFNPLRKPYGGHFNLTPPPHSPLSPFKNDPLRGTHSHHHSNTTMMSPKLGGRRSSISSLNPSELFGSLVGSYEESILSGRMSTLPSKPINFTVQIGVLAKGKCRSSLKCPPHLNMDFPAYFYQHGNSDSPSPYVGTVDLEHNELQGTVDKRFPHGYRIPPRGQLQVIIKNPNKTAVKFFLIPYDFSDMPENSKTFLRQKSYSVPGPSRENQTLRYAIHLQFCSPSKKRIYLYKNIRLVFSHRVPDGSERLKVVCEGPSNPKYIPALNLPSTPNPAVKETLTPMSNDPSPMDVNGNPIPPFSAAEAFARREFRRPSITSSISESLLKIKLSENAQTSHDILVEPLSCLKNPEHQSRVQQSEGFTVLEPSKVLPK